MNDEAGGYNHPTPTLERNWNVQHGILYSIVSTIVQRTSVGCQIDVILIFIYTLSSQVAFTDAPRCRFYWQRNKTMQMTIFIVSNWGFVKKHHAVCQSSMSKCWQQFVIAHEPRIRIHIFSARHSNQLFPRLNCTFHRNRLTVELFTAETSKDQ